ncbi:MAG: polyprenyl synthetase [Actinomycetia bacterium]|nr:polyprenyl synthetase [Actinomycetes bacterium]
MPMPLDHADLRRRVSGALESMLVRQKTLLTGISPDLAPLADALTAFLDGGKRLRPAFAYWGWRGAGGEDGPEIVRAVAALEWVQACALIHDDVMDGSDTRRGQPAMHRRFEAHHRAAGWRGDPANFGTAVAILLGDTSLIWADDMLNTSGLPPEALLRAQPVYDEMRTEIMAGQYLDLLTQVTADSTVERAMTVVRYKSAKYTIERPLHFGAALAGAPAELTAAYSAYGLPLGEAFQLRDDVLGVFGDPAETGKPAGDDIREGKRTVLIAKALARATEAEAALVETHLGDPQLGPGGVDAVREVISTSGALAETEKLIAELTDRALTALHSDLIAPGAADVLRELAVAATARRV